MCFIQDVMAYVKELIGFSNNTEEDINEITISPGQQMQIEHLCCKGIITCISYDEFVITINSLSKTYGSVNECYNWFYRSARYMLEFDYHIG